MNTDHVHASAGAITFSGHDAVKLYQATMLVGALKFYAKTKMQVNRAYTPTAMLKLASSFSGKSYKRGALLEAAADVQTWADAMKAALPVVRDCTYPACKCIVQTSTSQPEPICPIGGTKKGGA